MTQLKEVFTFSNGLEIPAIGLGTWQMSPEEAEQMTAYALNNGYIHIDTARTYVNEEGVGKGMKASGVNREDFFLTTKVSAFSKTYDEAKKDIEDSLTALDTEYLDLVIIHAPRPWDKMHTDGPIEKMYFEENLQVWRALEEAYEAGKVKAIGVSNFEIDDLVNLLENVKIKPMLNQIKYHIGFRDEQLVQYCQENDMIVEAYSPIGTGKLLNNPDIQTIADKYNKSTAQIAIRYCYQKGLVVLPKSVHEEYVDNNADLDFEILATDMDYLNRLVIN
ncbi:aldo/keto reductase [Aerococcaceae bacterium INB8]|uniref:Aldo/keto reductase n=1 Tax=Ruoffia halotolerans TaxID=2748684 RepID=A0A839A5Y9_9LACT|nr:aldo/keto reductase [Ruoffia halotolerans]MBA5729656.1 aldo/keto reductase [Ruoffia halotolerans]